MTRKKLIKQLKEKNPKLNLNELESVLDIFAESIINALKVGREVEIRDFGSYRLRKLKANAYLRNPKTNQLIYRPERVRVKFKASKKLNKFINE